MDRISPSEGGDAGSIPARRTKKKLRPAYRGFLLFIFVVRGRNRTRGGSEGTLPGSLRVGIRQAAELKTEGF